MSSIINEFIETGQPTSGHRRMPERQIKRIHKGILSPLSEEELILLEYLMEGDYSRLRLSRLAEDPALVERLRNELDRHMTLLGDMTFWLHEDFPFSGAIQERATSRFHGEAKSRTGGAPGYFTVAQLPKTRIILRQMVEHAFPTGLPEEVRTVRRLLSTLQGFSDFPLSDYPETALQVAFPKGYSPEFSPEVVLGDTLPTETEREKVRFLVEKVLGLDPETAPEQVNYYTFVEHGLQRMLWIHYRNSPASAVIDAYHGKIRAFQFRERPYGYWHGAKGRQRAIEAIRWLVEEKLRIPVDEIPGKINTDLLEEHGLETPMNLVFRGSPYELINAAYPGMFEPWEMEVTPTNYFNEREDRQVKAIKWLVEGKLGYAIPDMTKEEIWDERVARKVTKDVIGNYGLRGLLAFFDNTPEKMLRLAYPDKWYDWSFIRHGMWKGEDGRELAARAVRWLFEERLCIPASRIPQCATQSLFYREGFSGLLTTKSLGFETSPYAAVENAYPGRFERRGFHSFGE